jgi:ribosomal protein S18 acetylase RimI-like enzyme
MDDLAIRRAAAADAAAIATVHVAAWHETYRGLFPESLLTALSVQDRTERWHRILTQPDPLMESATFVAAPGGRAVVGFGSCGRQRASELLAAGLDGEISTLYVLAAHHRQGLGRRLMAEMARDLKARGLRGAGLWVLRDNLGARRFYDALGGEVVGQRIDSRAPGEELDEVAYGWRDLAALAG